jgi:hypothetical protein
MAGNHRAPKTVRMSLCGHFDADLVIFECRNISNMSDSGDLGFRKDGRPDMAGDHRAPKRVRMSSCGHFDTDLVIFECWNISNMADGGHLGFLKDGHQLK